MTKDKCGIYQILCSVSGKSYVGSSRRIYRRWHEHRRNLRKGDHRSPRLQRAWSKHGEAAFAFSVLEECTIDELFAREQVYLDLKKRDYNSMSRVRVITPEMRAKITAAIRLRAARITHCPHGHEYTAENKAVGKKGEPLCRECARIRTRAALAAETPEEKADRLRKNREYHQRHREHRLIMQRNYVARTKDKKRAYDIAYRPIKNARRRRKAA